MAIRTRRRSTLKQAVANNAPPTPANASAVWWADDIAQADGSQVATWTDRVNNISVTQATANARPLYDVDGLNCKPSVSFDGIDDFLTVNNIISNSSIGCVVAVSLLSKKNNSALWATGRGYAEAWPENYMMGVSVTEGMRMQHNNSNTGPASADVVRTTDSSLGTMTYEWSTNGSLWSMRKDNALQALTPTARTNSGEWFQQIPSRTTFSLGACPYGQVPAPYHNNFFGGSIAYLGIFDAPLSTQDRYNLYKWIESYYGITGMPGLSDYEQAVLADSPSAFWPMQETSGDVKDIVNSINDGMVAGTLTYGQPGVGAFKSIRFNSSGYISVADSPSWSSMDHTIEGWVNSGGNDGRSLWRKVGSGSSFEWSFGRSAGQYRPRLNNSGNTVWKALLAGTFSSNTWYHVVQVYDNSTGYLTLYIDGVEVASTNTIVGGVRQSDLSGQLMLGAANGGTEIWDGRMTMVSFYGHALSQSQIQAHYEAMTS